ncbi:DNA cytosine methyltransferase [Thermosynechococcaceae cyanobacterium BACA0444]|uniref:DNA (cytosine-5-)-methyltransferase n=1 Tax=Pseudocalidococcus azoricus BACA0444 TaxID=2918990 RepID=A0AAE4FSG6_9CYAN|nr:DNA cytosine methyltransferase [Pseudocalidococcus azoricus]MDS3860739.1 DNA cytosine methyltransferase [Pseudocalidococcus azoricus BACA0444]
MFLKQSYRVIDLFSGCGGMSFGFQSAGYELVAAYDYWLPAINVYQQNFDHPIFNVDLGDPLLDFHKFKSFDAQIIIGGPPCQDFSHAGKRNEELGRADLTIAFAKIVSYIRPRLFVMENVDRILKSKKYKVAKDLLKKTGYGLTEVILNATFCHVPQNRKRLFLIGDLGAYDNFMSNSLEQNLSLTPLTVRQYFEKELAINLDIEYYYRHPRNYSRRAIYSIDEPSATIRGVNRPIPKNYQIHPADACNSIERVRPLTTRERATIQTFPIDFLFAGTKTDIEQMIGNAVPVNLAHYVATSVMNYIKCKEQNQSTTYEQLSLLSSQLQSASSLVSLR